MKFITWTLLKFRQISRLQRVDHHDAVYKTKKGKFNAVVEEVIEAHEKGQPVLVGTITIETSELLSEHVKKKGIPHNVLKCQVP